MKMLSVMLYKEEAVMAIIAGMAYCIKSFPIFSALRLWGADLISIFFLKNQAKVVFFLPLLINFAHSKALLMTQIEIIILKKMKVK